MNYSNNYKFHAFYIFSYNTFIQIDFQMTNTEQKQFVRFLQFPCKTCTSSISIIEAIIYSINHISKNAIYVQKELF